MVSSANPALRLEPGGEDAQGLSVKRIRRTDPAVPFPASDTADAEDGDEPEQVLTDGDGSEKPFSAEVVLEPSEQQSAPETGLFIEFGEDESGIAPTDDQSSHFEAVFEVVNSGVASTGVTARNLDDPNVSLLAGSDSLTTDSARFLPKERRSVGVTFEAEFEEGGEFVAPLVSED